MASQRSICELEIASVEASFLQKLDIAGLTNNEIIRWKKLGGSNNGPDKCLIYDPNIIAMNCMWKWYTKQKKNKKKKKHNKLKPLCYYIYDWMKYVNDNFF